MKKRLLSILLTFCMVLSLLPTAALAADPTPVLAEGSVARTTTLDLATSANLSYRATDGTTKSANPATTSITDTAEGWSWVFSSKTLTLSGVHILSAASDGIVLPGGATITLASGSQNYVRGADAAAGDVYGIKVGSSGVLTINGAGSIVTIGGTTSESTKSSFGIGAYNLNIVGTPVIHAIGGESTGSSGQSYGISATGFTMTGGELTATAGKGDQFSTGINVTGSGNMAVSGSAWIYASGEKRCISLNTGTLTTTDDAVVIASARKADGKVANKAIGTAITGTHDAAYAVYGVALNYKTLGNTLDFSLNPGDQGSLDTDGYKWVQTSKALTLKNLILTPSGETEFGINLPADATVTLEGINIIHSGNKATATSVQALSCAGGIAVTGTGKLTAIGGSAFSSYGIQFSGTAQIGGGANVTAIGGPSSNASCGIELASGVALTLNADSTVTAIGGAGGSASIGINGTSTATLNASGRLTAIGGTATTTTSSTGYGSYGIVVPEGVIFADTSVVTAVSGTASLSNKIGIYSKSITLAGKVAAGSASVSDVKSAGIKIGTTSATVSPNAQITASGGPTGLGVDCALTVPTTSRVSAAGLTRAILAVPLTGTVAWPAGCGISTDSSDTGKTIRTNSGAGTIVTNAIIGPAASAVTAVATLQQLQDAITNGNIQIKLTANITGAITIPQNNANDYTIDLNGKTLTHTDTTITHDGSGTLTITDTATDGKVIVAVASVDPCAIRVNSTAKLVVTGNATVSAVCNDADKRAWGITNYGTLTVSGNAKVTAETVSTTNPSNAIGSSGDNATTTIMDNAKITAAYDAIYVWAGKVTVDGGTVSSTGGRGINSGLTGTVNITGGTISSTSDNAIYNAGTSKLSVRGGTIFSETSNKDAIYNHGVMAKLTGGNIAKITGSGSLKNDANTDLYMATFTEPTDNKGKTFAITKAAGASYTYGLTKSTHIGNKWYVWLPAGAATATYDGTEYTATVNTSGTATFALPADAVAELTHGGTTTNYATVAAAVAAAVSGDTIKLLGNSLEPLVTIPDGKALTIDLNGKTWNSTGSGTVKKVGTGTLTIKDTAANGQIINSTDNTNLSHGVVALSGTATANDTILDLQSGTIAYTGTGDGNTIYSMTSGKTVVSGGTISNINGNAIYGGGVFSITGGTLSSQNGNAICKISGTANITGGTFTAVRLRAEQTGKIEISGGTFNTSLRVEGQNATKLSDVLKTGYTFKHNGTRLTGTELAAASYTGNLTVDTAPIGADVTAGRYTWKQVFDCYRSPSTPVVDQSFRVYKFARPYDAVNRSQFTEGEISGKTFYIKTTGLTSAPFALWMADSVAQADAGGGRAVSTRGNIYGSGSEGFLYISTDGMSGGYGYFLSTKNHGYGDSVTYNPEDAKLEPGDPVTPPAPAEKVKKSIPTASYNGTTLTGVTANMKYSLDKGARWTAITGDNFTVTGEVTATNGVWVVDKGDNVTTLDSDPQEIYVIVTALPTASEIFEGQKLSDSTLSLGTVTAVGTNPATVTGTFAWQSGYLIPAKGDNQPFAVRFTPTGSFSSLAPFDLEVKVKVKPLGEQSTPNATFEASTMTLSDVDNTMKYSVDGGANWVAIAGNTADLTGKAVTTTHGIQVYKPGNGSTTKDSPVQTITITKALPPVYTVVQPTASVSTGAITGGTAQMEYRNVALPNTWVSADDVAAATLAVGTYEIRTKATGNALASDIQTIVIKAYAAPVSVLAGRYTWKQVFDCQRSPATPVPGKSFEVYNFDKPYDGATGSPIADNISAKVFYIKTTNNTGAPFSLWMADNSADANAGLGRAISTKGNIYGAGDEGFLYIDSGSSYNTFGYFISNFDHNYGDRVVYVPDTGKLNNGDTIPPKPTAQKNPVPHFTFDANINTLSGDTIINGTTQYSLNGGVNWTNLPVGGAITGAVDEAYGVWVRNTGNGTTTLTSEVQKIYLMKTADPVAAPIRVGDALSTSALTGGRVMTIGTTDLNVAGTWSWKSGYLVMTATGTQSYVARFTPTNTAIGPVEVSISVTVDEKLPEYTGGGDYTPPKKPVIIDGKTENIGTEKKSGDTTVITVDQPKLTEQIGKAKDESSVVVPVSTNTTATVSLVVKNVEDMAKKDMTLSVTTGSVTYNLPTASMDTAALADAFPGQDTAKIPFEVTIKASDVKVEGTTVVVKPTGFTVAAVYGGKSVAVDKFSTFVERTFEITKAQSEKITTAVVVEQGGTLRHVPTNVFQKDGKYYATVNSMTNSVYTLVQNEVTFADAAGKWYADVANEVGSRKIVVGTGKGDFDGDAKITRAEYAAMMVRALGLPQSKSSSFTDVPANAWYAGYVSTASEYGIVKGIGKNKFNPEGLITRQEAMQMIYNASKLTGFPTLLNARNLPAEFSDFSTVRKWAAEAVSWCLNNNLSVNLKGMVKPTEEITRGEMSAMILLLLQRSELVDVR